MRIVLLAKIKKIKEFDQFSSTFVSTYLFLFLLTCSGQQWAPPGCSCTSLQQLAYVFGTQGWRWKRDKYEKATRCSETGGVFVLALRAVSPRKQICMNRLKVWSIIKHSYIKYVIVYFLAKHVCAFERLSKKQICKLCHLETV